MTPRLRQLSPLALCAVVALLGGLLGGATAVHGLRPNNYGPIDPPALARSNAPSPNPVSAASDGDHGEDDPAGCYDCSERDLGYRWASLQAIHTSAECPSDSWGFRQGCLDYTGGV